MANPSFGGRSRTWLWFGLGFLLFSAYGAWLFTRPRGLFEFGYAPGSAEPLPYSAMRGFTYEQLWGHVARFFLLTPALAAITWALHQVRPLPLLLNSRKWALAAAGACVAITSLVLLGVLRGRAIADDELVYQMQATFLAEGRLGSSELGFTPPDIFSIPTRAGYTGKYLPGEPLLQIVGLFVGIPAILHIPILALTLFAWHRAIAERAGNRNADFATLALALSPMVMLTSATGLTQASSLLAIAVAGLGFEWARGRKPIAGAVLAGFGIAFGIATRPQAMIPAGMVLGPAVLFALSRRKAWAPLGAYALTLGAGLSLVAAYNHALSGSPFTLPWYLQCSIEHFGFGQVWKHDAYTHTPVTALENLLVVAVRWNAWWLGFPCSLAVLYLWWRLGRPLGGLGIWLWVAFALLAFEALYYSTGISDTGAIYHYELILPCSLIAGMTLNAALSRWPALTAIALAVQIGLGTSTWLGEQIWRLSRLVHFIHADSDAALARIQGPAILFYEMRDSELRRTGWLFDGFPRRYRGRNDAVVTFPMLVEPLRKRVAAAYPGRSCWYYHRDNLTEAAELFRCEDATALMNRGYQAEVASALWIRPTAYNVTDYDPIPAHVGRHLRDRTGQRMVLCCGLRAMKELGAPLRPDAFDRCVEDGP